MFLELKKNVDLDYYFFQYFLVIFAYEIFFILKNCNTIFGAAESLFAISKNIYFN